MADAIELDSVRKSFGARVAVRDLSLRVPVGSVYGFIGPNGAGKTTTIRMILSILFPDSGRVRVLGEDSALDAKDRIGYLPEERGLYRKMRAAHFLRFMARLKGQRGPGLKRRVDDWLERVGLGGHGHKRCEELSKGMQQKLQFAATVLNEPELLVLDEPFSGLDPLNMRLLRELIAAEQKRGATIIFSTHVMVHAEQICDRVVLIKDGSKLLDDSLQAIRARFDPNTVLFEPMTPTTDTAPLAALPFVERVERAAGHLQLALRAGCDPARAVRDIAGAVPAARIELHRPTLEDVFVHLVGDDSGDGHRAGA